MFDFGVALITTEDKLEKVWGTIPTAAEVRCHSLPLHARFHFAAITSYILTVVDLKQEAISSVSGRSELNTRVAVDGLGNIYALGTFNDAVFKFGPDGKFIIRFGCSGGNPGQFRTASAIAVDGRGRVYVSEGVQIFDGDGRYLDTFER